jgi:cytochrome c peroxidase
LEDRELSSGPEHQPVILALLALALVIPLGLDLYMPVPEGNPVTEEKVALGRRLFHDRRLSRDRSIACASCHDPDRAFTDARPLAIGVQRRLGRRSAPALIRFVNGNRGALSSGQRAGLQLFRGKGNCTACHVGPTFTDERFHNTGVAWRVATLKSSVPGRFRDDGRFAVTGRLEDRGAFKTPTLRDVARTAPYMHDGSLATLGEVVVLQRWRSLQPLARSGAAATAADGPGETVSTLGCRSVTACALS